MARRKAEFPVVKLSGETEPYDRGKILSSLRRAGAGEKLARSIIKEAERGFYPGIATSEVFDSVMGLLEREEARYARLYDLKGGIRRLGPAGYSFETYAGEILREYGHTVRLRQRIEGRCATHEIDIVAEREQGGKPLRLLAECKYHNTGGSRVDLKEMMYTWARFLDINERAELKRPYDGLMMISNTRVSGEATSFAECRGISVLSWRYPKTGSLEDLITARNLYPVTVLRAAAPLGSDTFSRAGLMLVKDFHGKDPRVVSRELRIPLDRARDIIREADVLLGRKT